RINALKSSFTVEDVYERAEATLRKCISHGTTHMRTHVEVDSNGGMVGFEALEQLAKDYAKAIDLDLCVFAQEGMTQDPVTDANVVAGLERKAPVIGGAPRYDPDGPGQIRRVFELAREFDVDIDFHLDVGPSAEVLDVLLVCELTEEMGWGGRVAVGHATKYAALPPDPLAKLGQRLRDAGVTVTVLPATDLFIMGRELDHNIVRGVTDAHALSRCGVNCCLSTNNILNPITPFGDGSMVRIAGLYANIIQRGTPEELTECFEMISHRPAQLVGQNDHALETGNPADIIVWDAVSKADAVSKVSHPRMGFKNGRRTFTRAEVELHIP
ncbi:MAG: amidohydrolase family protein, partial [Methyloligellaceae bacterium]